MGGRGVGVGSGMELGRERVVTLFAVVSGILLAEMEAGGGHVGGIFVRVEGRALLSVIYVLIRLGQKIFTVDFLKK